MFRLTQPKALSSSLVSSIFLLLNPSPRCYFGELVVTDVLQQTCALTNTPDLGEQTQNERGRSSLAEAAAGNADLPPSGTAGAAGGMPSNEESRIGEDDWLVVAAAGGPRANALPSSSRPTPPSAGKSSLEAKAAARRASGGGWVMAAAGKSGLPLQHGDDGDEAAGGAARKVPGKGGALAAHGEPGGWMETAILSGRLGAASSGDDCDAVRDEPRTSQGVSIETQTDENIGKAVAESTKPKLPPWAKPWSPPPPTVGVDPVSNPAAEVAADNDDVPEPSPGGKSGWSKRASCELPDSLPPGWKGFI